MSSFCKNNLALFQCTKLNFLETLVNYFITGMLYSTAKSQQGRPTAGNELERFLLSCLKINNDLSDIYYKYQILRVNQQLFAEKIRKHIAITLMAN